MKHYEGIGTGTVVGAKTVLVNGHPLINPTRHSGGFNWGYGGSGPYDLAYAILHDLYGKQFASRHAQQFKWDVIAHIPQGEAWQLTETQIDEWKKGLGE